MMTCVSDRSGIASSGVCRTAHTPAAATNRRGEQHQEAVRDRPADQRGDHFFAPAPCPAAGAIDVSCEITRRRDDELEVDARAILHIPSARRQAAPCTPSSSRPSRPRVSRSCWIRISVPTDARTVPTALCRTAPSAPHAGCRCRRASLAPRFAAVHAREHAFEVRLGVDEELARRRRPADRLRCPCGSRSTSPLSRPISTSTGANLPSPASTMTTLRLAGLDHRFRRHQDRLGRRRTAERDVRKHAGLERRARIGDDDSRAHRARLRVDFRAAACRRFP